LDGNANRFSASFQFQVSLRCGNAESESLSPDESDDILSARAYWSRMLRTVT
jgi:hypothetical protein